MESSSVGEQISVGDGIVPDAVVTVVVVLGLIVIGVIMDADSSSAAFAKGRAEKSSRSTWRGICGRLQSQLLGWAANTCPLTNCKSTTSQFTFMCYLVLENLNSP